VLNAQNGANLCPKRRQDVARKLSNMLQHSIRFDRMRFTQHCVCGKGEKPAGIPSETGSQSFKPGH
jgi:hypothetical protein